MKASIIALATAAALSISASGVALAQDTTTSEVIEDCPINTEGVPTESGVATPEGESLVSETSDDQSASDEREIPVDACDDGALGQGVVEGTSDADND
jgi:hypothetical protein